MFIKNGVSLTQGLSALRQSIEHDESYSSRCRAYWRPLNEQLTTEFYAVIVMNVLFRSRIDNHINLRI